LPPLKNILLLLLSKQHGTTVAELLDTKHKEVGAKMKYPYIPLRSTTAGNGLKIRITGERERLEESIGLRRDEDGNLTMACSNHRPFMRPRSVALILVLSLGLCFKTTALLAGEDGVTKLMSKTMKDVTGKEGLLITVEYPPGGSNPIYRHNAHAFVYVLEGSVVMQLKGGKPVTLTPGQTFYEGPNDIHMVSRNASNTEPAKFVVFLIKNNGAPVLIPVK
jgi:quercetin dioxygenase-like cupin family protein